MGRRQGDDLVAGQRLRHAPLAADDALGGRAGVVYVNRGAGATTGAWPGTQSFCGWKSSGSTGKGGLGPYSLTPFMWEQSRTVVG